MWNFREKNTLRLFKQASLIVIRAHALQKNNRKCFSLTQRQYKKTSRKCNRSASKYQICWLPSCVWTVIDLQHQTKLYMVYLKVAQDHLFHVNQRALVLVNTQAWSGCSLVWLVKKLLGSVWISSNENTFGILITLFFFFFDYLLVAEDTLTVVTKSVLMITFSEMMISDDFFFLKIKSKMLKPQRNMISAKATLYQCIKYVTIMSCNSHNLFHPFSCFFVFFSSHTTALLA